MVLRVLVDPAVVDHADRDGVEIVPLLPALLATDDEPGLLEQPKVLRHAEPGHLAALLRERLQLGLALPVGLEQRIQKQPPSRVGECFEHKIVLHVSDYR